ncbi:MAG TPA: Asp-tRNA(Asn)/Glu-tRNA(Gln) amidotransferase GatCAB subunit C [Firmicutes bacterium]|nr:Asp-tRNA(Asn)/Glu-tRNA(Gln) amidotransferase GatCAB subunit C [Bacillota bacterium]
MKKYDINVLKDAANRLLFDMSDEEYETLLNEFDIITKQMLVLGENESIDKYEPMTFPFECATSYLREDVPTKPLSREEALRNANHKAGGQIKLPKVVQ